MLNLFSTHQAQSAPRAVGLERFPRVVFLVLTATGLLLASIVLKYSLGAYLLWSNPEWTNGTWLSTSRGIIARSKSEVSNLRLELEDLQNERPLQRLAKLALNLLDREDKYPPASNLAGKEPRSPVAREGNEAAVSMSRLKAGLVEALQAEPFSASGYRSLALLTELENDSSRTQSLMEAAARLSRLDPVPHYWLMNVAYRTGNFPIALGHADILLRATSGSGRLVYPTLANLAEQPSVQRDVVALLETNPPWRANFFNSLTSYTTDLRTPLVLMQALNGSGNPPTAAERYSYMRFLISYGRIALAYYSWLHSLS